MKIKQGTKKMIGGSFGGLGNLVKGMDGNVDDRNTEKAPKEFWLRHKRNKIRGGLV